MSTEVDYISGLLRSFEEDASLFARGRGPRREEEEGGKGEEKGEGGGKGEEKGEERRRKRKWNRICL